MNMFSWKSRSRKKIHQFNASSIRNWKKKYSIYIKLNDISRIELEAIEINNEESIDVSKNLDRTYHRIIECVKKHKEAIEYAMK